MKKLNWKNCLTIGAFAALTLPLLTGCGAPQINGAQQFSPESGTAGTVLLSVNPEIEVEYDNGGLVLEIEGVNEDGKTIVTDFENYKGKDCRTVVNELVKEIHAAGYLSKTINGQEKNIVVKLLEGSTYPDDGFLEDVAEGVRDAVRTCGIGSETMTIQREDLDENGRIGQDKAKELVLSQLGLHTASFNNHEYELEDGVYEFSFSVNGVKYEYEVDARTGKVLEADIDGNDDWDDRDEWDDWEDFDNQDDEDDDRDEIDDQDDDDDDRDEVDDQDEDDDWDEIDDRDDDDDDND